MKYLIFDTETTGLIKHPSADDSVQPKIIEWAGIIVTSKGEIIRELSILVNPGQKLESRITEITGLTDEDLADAPSFPEIVEKLRPMFSQSEAMIAHNLPFDYNMMALELARNGLSDSWAWPAHRICTVAEHVDEWGRRPKLSELYEHYTGVKLNQTHRALDDVKALYEVCKLSGVIS